MTDLTCTFPKYDKEDPYLVIGECGRIARLALKKDGQVYPRCNIHSTTKALLHAEHNGFEIDWLEPESF